MLKNVNKNMMYSNGSIKTNSNITKNIKKSKDSNDLSWVLNVEKPS